MKVFNYMKEIKKSMNVLDFNDTINCESCTDEELANQWETIDWNKARNYINRLQIRIVKAVESKKKSLVIRLQYLITHSFYGKALAIKRVTTNKGKKSPGIDGAIWLTSTEKMKAVSLLKTKGYVSSPLKRVYIEKYGKKEKRCWYQ